MRNAGHPSALLKPGWIEIIRSSAAKAEQDEQLQPQQLELIYQQQWFKLLVPEEYGGPEMSLPELVRLEEALAWADGSLAWVVTLCAGAGWFGGFLNPEVAREVFADPEVCLAGSGAATGTAEKTADGYILNGKWQYASGVLHATHFTANCVVTRNGEAIKDNEGNLLIIPFIIDRKDAKLISAWKYVGMMGTGSHAFEVKDLHLADQRSFRIERATAVITTGLYAYPFRQLAEATLAANLSGMALHFIDLCEPVFQDRIIHKKLTINQTRILTESLQEAKDTMQNCRNEFYEALDRSWPRFKTAAGQTDLKAVSQTSRILAIVAREQVDILYPYCGLMAASPDTELNRVWRDLHTASQHSLLTFPE